MNRTRTLHPALLLAVLGIGLAGCKSKFDANLAADPADNVQSVKVSLEGLDLQQDDGTIKNLERNDTGTPDLVQFDGDILFSLISDAKLKKGTYTGVRLVYSDVGSAITPTPDSGTGTGTEETLDVPEAGGNFTTMKLKIKSGKDAQLLIALDLRLSIVKDTSGNYSLVPVLRAVQSGDEAEISGTVGSSFTSSSDCVTGAVVYAFPGQNVDPSVGTVLPIATAPITAGRYDLRFLPSGDYTVAVTCDGEKQNGGAINGDVTFADETHDTTLDDGETATIDF